MWSITMQNTVVLSFNQWMLPFSVCLGLFAFCQAYVRDYWQSFKKMVQEVIYNCLVLSPNAFCLMP